MNTAKKRRLLAIMELGGYPNFVPLYERIGFEVTSVVSVRKALGVLREREPDVVVAEFNYQSDFRDRTSSLESLLAVVQRYPAMRVLVFFDKEHAHQLARLQARYPLYATLSYPISETELQSCLQRACDEPDQTV